MLTLTRTIVTSFIGLYIFTRSLFLSKRSLHAYTSQCSAHYLRKTLLKDQLKLSDCDIARLVDRGVLSEILLLNDDDDDDDDVLLHSSDGCWMGRRVSSVVMVIVDALRYDLAEKYLHSLEDKTKNYRYKFIADPPTVTRQRLLGLTTGGLPTFGDIMSQFGSFSSSNDGIDDSWLQQLVDVPLQLRGYSEIDKNYRQLAFVGDDTWIDLFPSQFDYSYPFPSFNTRDLDTVDNGCFLHLPYMLKHLSKPLRSQKDSEKKLHQVKPRNTGDFFFELAIAHTLGIDHVGHTFGAFSDQMVMKYAQTDAEIEKVLDVIDEADKRDCRAVLVFGDHGMSDDGNHGGSTENEVTSAFYIHFSPGCKMDQNSDAQSLVNFLCILTCHINTHH